MPSSPNPATSAGVIIPLPRLFSAVYLPKFNKM